ncbi:hypothetical protein [Roseivirga echinicomitans]|nr:hypothetical protein [Roseivirga echinicomitans]
MHNKIGTRQRQAPVTPVTAVGVPPQKDVVKKGSSANANEPFL